MNKDRDLIGIDVSGYILSKVKCSHLKLKKLVYMCYVDYLCKYNEKLFTDKILAYQYGPIVETVYNKYKNSGKKILKNNIDREDEMLIFRSRILASRNGINKAFSIDKTLEKYSNLTSSELVSLTHRENSPWTKSKEIITDDMIIKYHKYEKEV